MSAGSWERMRAVARHDLRILRRDPFFLVIFTVAPLGFMAFNDRTFGSALSQSLGREVDGSAFVVPGAAVLFSAFMVGNLGFGIFREHGWGTWERLRASPLTSFELMVGKSLTPILTLGIQLTALLLGGTLLYGLEIPGSIPAFAAVAVALAVMEVCLGFFLLSICRSVVQLNAIINGSTMLLGGLGGAMVPVALLPGWARAVAPATPAYWAMRGFRAITIDGGGFSAVALPIAVLLGFAVVCLLLAVRRFQVEETKVSWA